MSRKNATDRRRVPSAAAVRTAPRHGLVSLTIETSQIGEGLVVVLLPHASLRTTTAQAGARNRRDLRARVNRREASKILGTSYENVKRLQRARQLTSGGSDERGHHWFIREEVEALAYKRLARGQGRWKPGVVVRELRAQNEHVGDTRAPRAQLVHSDIMREIDHEIGRRRARPGGKPRGSKK